MVETLASKKKLKDEKNQPDITTNNGLHFHVKNETKERKI